VVEDAVQAASMRAGAAASTSTRLAKAARDMADRAERLLLGAAQRRGKGARRRARVSAIVLIARYVSD